MSAPPDTTVEIRIPSDAEYVRIVRLAVAGIGARLKFPYDDIEDLKLAVSEACNNAILHATDLGGVVVRCTQTADCLEIEVRDQGAGFSAAGEARPPAEELSENGLGLFLMQALMDEVAWEPTEGGGTRVNLKKRLPRCL
jgi:serine/threonine-protein kinase RsbW